MDFDQKSLPFSIGENRDHGILLIHGFTASPSHVLPLGEALAGKTGCTVAAPLLPGHRTTMEDLKRFGWRDMLSAALEAFDDLASRCSRVSVIGHSMGGALALLVASRRNVDRLVPITPGLTQTDPRARFAPILKFLPLKSYWDDFELTYPDEAPGYILDYDQSYAGFTYKSAGDAILLGSKARKVLPQVSCPVLLVHARLDETVTQGVVDLILSRIGSEHTETLWLEQSRHICVIGPEREIMFNRIAEFLS